MKRILVLGGGASGILAAIAAAEESRGEARVTLIEQNPKVGKKLLATGNGRCNLDNRDPAPGHYFTSDRKRLEEMLKAIERLNLERWFEDHGLITRSDEAGRVYPYSNQASDFVDLLSLWLERAGVQVQTGCRVKGLERGRNCWQLTLESGRVIPADAVICAMGGKAGPQFGTDGFSYGFAWQQGCRYEPIYPCLVPLKCRKDQVADLSGVRVKAAASLWEGENRLAGEEGEIQFTDYGLSGIAVMNLSGYFVPGREHRALSIRLDLFPHMSEEELTALLQRRVSLMSQTDAAGFMTGLLQRRVGLAVWKAAGLGSTDRKISALKQQCWQKLAHGLKNWEFNGLSPKEWKLAQTTGGGVRLSLLDPESFRALDHDGLYFVGESVDCAGQCGGFNLHWAFGSGILAGRDCGRI